MPGRVAIANLIFLLAALAWVNFWGVTPTAAAVATYAIAFAANYRETD